jgi:acyl carrier protein
VSVSEQQVTIEHKLLSLWRETLQDDSLDAEADPLQLGATSMQIMSVIGRIAEEMAIEVPVEALFDAITIAEQAQALAGAV